MIYLKKPNVKQKDHFFFEPISAEFNDPRVVDKLTVSYRLVMATFKRLSDKHKTIMASHETLARLSGVCVTTVKTVINYMVNNGLLAKIYVHWRTCRYRLSNFFSLSYVQEVLSHLFKAIYKFPLSLLLPNYELYMQSELCLLIKEKKNIKNIKRDTYKERDALLTRARQELGQEEAELLEKLLQTGKCEVREGIRKIDSVNHTQSIDDELNYQLERSRIQRERSQKKDFRRLFK